MVLKKVYAQLHFTDTYRNNYIGHSLIRCRLSGQVKYQVMAPNIDHSSSHTFVVPRYHKCASCSGLVAPKFPDSLLTPSIT